MNATSNVGPVRDFSDVAIWRGSLAAIVVGYLLWVISAAMWRGVSVGWLDLQSLVFALRYALEAPMLVAGFCGMAVLVVIGYFVMAAYKGDHTTHFAAMIIGARTAAVALGIVIFFALIANLGANFADGGAFVFGLPTTVLRLATPCALILAAGALTGFAARIAAGAPTVESMQVQTDASAS